MIDVALEIRNSASAPAATYAYFQLTHDGTPDTPTNSIAATFGAQSFIGFGVYTEERAFQKVHLSDLDKGKSDHAKQAADGWLAFVQHYFVSAWLPPQGVQRDYVTEKRQDGTYAGRVMVQPACAGGHGAVSAPLYAGPRSSALRAARRGSTSSWITASRHHRLAAVLLRRNSRAQRQLGRSTSFCSPC